MKKLFRKKRNIDNETFFSSEEKQQTVTNETIRIPDTIKGLSDQEVQQLYAEGKYNKEVEDLSRTTKQIILDNSLTLFNFINLFLAVAVFAVGYPKNALFFWIIIINTAIGVFQEIHAKRTIDKLSIVNKTEATALRQGQLTKIFQDEIVLGDVLVLTLGNQVPSDGLVLHGEGMEVDESLLTGESDKITKMSGDKIMSGSFITSGLGFVKITAVGEDNFVSKLSKEAKTEKKSTSELMNSLNLLIKGLTFAIVPIGLLLFWSQYQSTQSFPKTVLGVSGALISMIPEGLMLLTSVAFAVGAANLARKQTLIQRLACIETLARVDTICLDKTGTITDGSLSFKELIPLAGFPASEIERAMSEMMAALSDQNATAKVLRKHFPLKETEWTVSETIPFSSDRKWSGVSFKEKGSFVMGAPEFIYSELPEELRERLAPYNEQGDRVLILIHSNEPLTSPVLPQEKETVAIFVIADTLRENAVDTFSYFAKQDVTLKVISGDNPITVSQIAKQAGIAGAENFVDMSKLTDTENFNELVEKTTVFGRVTPYQKRELIQALKENGHTTCMTGDGVNDILSLREADVSVAMASGSDAARAVSDVVLLNSDFSSMIQVLNEGRRVINNIERVASMYMVKTIYSAILAVTFIFLFLPYPFAPLQLTPINTLTVGIPSFILALEPNYQRIKGHFLTNILRISVPGALTVVFNILVLQLAGIWFDLSHQDVSTMCVLLTGCVGFQVLLRAARPLDLKKKIMIGLLLTAFLICFLFFGDFFMLTSLFTKNVFFYLPLILGSRSIFNYISLFMTRAVYEIEKRKEKKAIKNKKRVI
ncbi:cation-translocating P-type ATPase [Enterococcus termitis]|uniref:Magnesium-transporting ATPase n=1 Tax=Enterococcus termitis TaxID=332950 RepID=A0A1E5GII5_9ENTE|nr:cation-translocating P-type ATPase [Enterococcus termitis]OEG12421.1 magnesium-transporting ATPase [Enterococcus termitis]OJG98746.1 HAD ATPase, P-type, family IC [Enterococcus termitis]